MLCSAQGEAQFFYTGRKSWSWVGSERKDQGLMVYVYRQVCMYEHLVHIGVHVLAPRAYRCACVSTTCIQVCMWEHHVHTGVHMRASLGPSREVSNASAEKFCCQEPGWTSCVHQLTVASRLNRVRASLSDPYRLAQNSGTEPQLNSLPSCWSPVSALGYMPPTSAPPH